MNKQKQIINIIAYLALVIINYTAVSLPFFGRRPGAVSDLTPTPFTPPDFSFRIWLFIYILLGIFIIYQARDLFDAKKTTPKELSLIGYLFALSCVFNIGWLVTWQSLHYVWSFVMIFLLWACLVRIYIKLAYLKGANWAVVIPFSIYLGWIAVATLANLNVLLIVADFGFFGLDSIHWSVVMTSIGIFGGLIMLYLNWDIWFALVIIWTLFGIYTKNNGLPELEIVANTALIGIVLLIAGIGAATYKIRTSQ